MKTYRKTPTIRFSKGCVGLALTAGFLVSGRAQVDHSIFIGSYEGTQTCLNCHGAGATWGDKAAELMATTHWTWVKTNTPTGHVQVLGKKNVINNYCVAVPSNEPRCTSCHVGLGWRDDTFDFNDPTKVDCLVCHDTTGTYKKTPTGAGEPDPTVDLTAVAQSVGKTSRATCGACHFYGGGGDAVKHGDLDSTMTNPTRALDVHMGTDGMNKNCSFCHAEGNHEVAGSRYSKSAPDSHLCESCHTATPHTSPELGVRLNAHTDRVGCQSCHVPRFARGGKATKMFWDWSTAGDRNPDGSDKVIKDADGNPIYHSKKGSFIWEANVVPDYVWFNGEVVYTTLDDVIDPAQTVEINQFQGDISDPNARIIPVKRFTGIQPYDAVSNTLAIPHLFPSSPTDTDAYWKGFNWTNALVSGMASVGRTFSGEVGWVNTEMLWVENHMVAPKEDALTCTDCHTPRGRLNFRALGYPEEEALRLQTLKGFEVESLIPSAPSGVELRWMGTPGHRYQVQYNTDVSNPGGWTNASDGERVAGASAAEMSWTEDVSGAGNARFYRVIRTDQ